jgi:hypothetical protein
MYAAENDEEKGLLGNLKSVNRTNADGSKQRNTTALLLSLSLLLIGVYLSCSYRTNLQSPDINFADFGISGFHGKVIARKTSTNEGGVTSYLFKNCSI